MRTSAHHSGEKETVMKNPKRLGLAFLASVTVVCAYFNAMYSPFLFEDIQVYLASAQRVLDGISIYQTPVMVDANGSFPDGLYFIYPPFAALVFIPFLLFGHFAILMFTILGVLALWRTIYLLLVAAKLFNQNVLRMSIVATVALVPLEPFITNISSGNINFYIVWLIAESFFSLKTWAPLHLGVASAIKFTSAIYALLHLIVRPLQSSLKLIAMFLIALLVGFIADPESTVEYFTKYVFGVSRVPSNLSGSGNQSILGILNRAGLASESLSIVWLLSASVLVVVALLLASKWWNNSEIFWPLALVTVVSLLVSPLSWTHHYVAYVFVFIASITSSWRPKIAHGFSIITYVFFLSTVHVTRFILDQISAVAGEPITSIVSACLTNKYLVINCIFLTLCLWRFIDEYAGSRAEKSSVPQTLHSD